MSGGEPGGGLGDKDTRETRGAAGGICVRPYTACACCALCVAICNALAPATLGDNSGSGSIINSGACENGSGLVLSIL